MHARWMRSGLAAILALALGAAAAMAAPPAAKPGDAAAGFQDTFKVDKAKLADTGEGTYFILVPGYKLIFEDGKDTLTITVLDETKMVDGVKCRIVEERETKGGKLEEISRNYFAVDKATGDAYYFGEDVDMYDKDGKVTGHEGGWLAGVDGARFGMLLPGKPMIGARYQQEVAPKAAMDRAEVVSITETVKVPAGKFTNCLKTRESSGLESGVEEKLYAPGVGLLKDGGFELARIEKPKVELPAAAAKAFKDAFPKGEIEKLEAEEENGVTVYDIEFKNGAAEQEMDLTADGTILEVTLVVDAKAVPPAAMKAIEKAAEGAKIGRIENVDIRYETKDGKAIKLARPVTHFAAEFTRGDKTTEVVVTPDGAPVKE